MYRIVVDHGGDETEIVETVDTFSEAVIVAANEVMDNLPLTPEVRVWQVKGQYTYCVLHMESGRGLQTNSERCH